MVCNVWAIHDFHICISIYVYLYIYIYIMYIYTHVTSIYMDRVCGSKTWHRARGRKNKSNTPQLHLYVLSVAVSACQPRQRHLVGEKVQRSDAPEITKARGGLLICSAQHEGTE